MRISLLPKSKRFIAALTDEVALHAEAKTILAANKQCDIAEIVSQPTPIWPHAFYIITYWSPDTPSLFSKLINFPPNP